MAWPVQDCLMIEPTECEDKGEMDRFVDSMLSIKEEIVQIENGTMDRDINPIKVFIIYNLKTFNLISYNLKYFSLFRWHHIH